MLTFAPMLRPADAPRGCLWREMARRFAAYKTHVVRPFFRDHFARIDRQVVLLDALGAIHAGPQAVDDMRRAMAEILTAFRPGRSGRLARLIGLKRIDRILFAATKADHLHHSQHPQLTAIMQAMLRDARDRADFAGARTEALAISRAAHHHRGNHHPQWRPARCRARHACRRAAGGLLPRRAAR